MKLSRASPKGKGRPELASGIFAAKMQERGRIEGSGRCQVVGGQVFRYPPRYQYLVMLTAPSALPRLSNPNGFGQAGTTGTWTFFLAAPPTREILWSPCASYCPECSARAKVRSRSSSFSQGSCISTPILALIHFLFLPHFTCCESPPRTRVDFPAILSLETSHPGKLPLT